MDTPTIVGRVGSLRGDLGLRLFREARENLVVARTNGSLCRSTGCLVRCSGRSLVQTRRTVGRGRRVVHIKVSPVAPPRIFIGL